MSITAEGIGRVKPCDSFDRECPHHFEDARDKQEKPRQVSILTQKQGPVHGAVMTTAQQLRVPARR